MGTWVHVNLWTTAGRHSKNLPVFPPLLSKDANLALTDNGCSLSFVFGGFLESEFYIFLISESSLLICFWFKTLFGGVI